MPGVNAMLKMFVLKVSLGLLMLRHFSAPVFESLWNEVCLLFGFAFTCSLLLRAEIKRWNRLRTFFFCPSKGMLERTLPGHATNLVNSVQFYIHRWMFCNITMTGQPQYESALPYPTGTRISRQLHIPDQSKFKGLKFNSLFVIDFICCPLLNGFPPWPDPITSSHSQHSQIIGVFRQLLLFLQYQKNNHTLLSACRPQHLSNFPIIIAG